MEKCTYCTQRIQAAQVAADKENRPLGRDEIATACQQACPTQAIVFGDLKDKGSAVARRRASSRHYALLEELGTRPRTTYLARWNDAPDDGGGHEAPPRPVDLPPDQSYGDVTDQLASRCIFARRRWLIALAVSSALGLLFVSSVVLFSRGVGIWGLNIPVNWAFAIHNYVCTRHRPCRHADLRAAAAARARLAQLAQPLR